MFRAENVLISLNGQKYNDRKKLKLHQEHLGYYMIKKNRADDVELNKYINNLFKMFSVLILHNTNHFCSVTALKSD